MRKLIVSPQARQDLTDIGDFIALDSRRKAAAFVSQIEQTILNKVVVRPLSFRVREELGPELRIAAHGRYLICFKATERTVEVVRIIHGSRDLPTLF